MALILRFSTLPGSPTWGTDTLFLLALGVVANDIGALFVGSAAADPAAAVDQSRTRRSRDSSAARCSRSWPWWSSASPSGATPGHRPGHLLILAIVISIMAPMGDLVESMFKRNLDVKDFGSIVKGHGGVLDRFDGFLFTLPAVYYLTIVLEPWTN